MALPAITTRVAFASNPFVAVPAWDDISGDLLGLQITRGRQYELDRIEAGTAIITLKNTSGDYWPLNPGSPYPGEVLPMRRINIRATYGVTTYDLFTGFVEAWSPGWISRGGIGTVMTVSAIDLAGVMAGMELNNAGEVQELSGTRIGNVLDEVGWLGGRALDAGQTLMIATGAQVDVNPMDHLFLVQDSELGRFFIRGDGFATFLDRHALLKGSYVTPQAIFGDGAGEMRYADVLLSDDRDHLYQEVRMTRSGGTEQVASDPAGILAYTKRALVRTGLLMPTDAEVLAQAQYLLSKTKDPVMRARQLVILPQQDDANLWPKVLLYELGTRITFRKAEAFINEDYHIEGLTHTYDAQTGLWTTGWQLSPASQIMFWILGTSHLGQTNFAFTTRKGW